MTKPYIKDQMVIYASGVEHDLEISRTEAVKWLSLMLNEDESDVWKLFKLRFEFSDAGEEGYGDNISDVYVRPNDSIDIKVDESVFNDNGASGATDFGASGATDFKGLYIH